MNMTEDKSHLTLTNVIFIGKETPSQIEFVNGKSKEKRQILKNW